MNTVRCSNCAAENAADLRFCTNCGKSLAPPNSAQATGANFGSPPQPPAKSKTGRNAAIIGGLGCLVLLIGTVAVCGILGYIGRNANNDNSYDSLATNNKTVGNNNLSLSNRGTVKPANSNSVVFGNSNSSATNDNTSSSQHPPTDEEFRNFLPAAVGDYQRQGETVDGNITEDYPGADKIVKADYVKKGKKVTVILAQFASPATAKQSYGYFLGGFKSVGAKVLMNQKVKNKTGIETGDLSIYSYSGKWETLIYADRFGFRITAPDRVTLGDFLKVFGSYMQLVGEN